jgi:hypothetical protein
MHRLLLILAAALAFSPAPSQALHSDVEIFTTSGPVAGSRLQVRFSGDRTLLVNGREAFDYQTGYGLWPADFRDLPGGAYATDDPGFQAFAGTFLAAEQLFYRPMGTAQHWNTVARTWSAAPAGTAIRIEGTVPEDIAIEALVFNDPVAMQLYDYYSTPTYITGAGILGPATKMIDQASNSGAFHTHLNWFLEAPGGAVGGPDGAYMVQMQIIDPTGKYLDSQPFNVIFSSGIAASDYAAAFLARIEAPALPDPIGITPAIPEPQLVVLLLAGLALLAMRRRALEQRRLRADVPALAGAS